MRRFFLASLLLIMAFILNFYFRKRLPYAYSNMLSYNQLYYPAEHLRISRLVATQGDSLIIVFKGARIKASNLFEVFYGDSLLVRQQGAFLTVKPRPDQKKFFVRLNSGPDTLEINIDYTPLYVYARAGNSSEDVYEVTSADLPITAAHLLNISTWQTPDPAGAGGKQAVHYLQDSMRIQPHDSSHVVISKIADFILKKTHGQLGVPADSLSGLTPAEQLEFVHNGKSKIWCGNFAQIFSFFASNAGLPVRVVNCGGNMLNVSVGAHSFNEVYLKERECWAYVDLTSQNVFVKKGSHFMNTVEIQRYLRFQPDGTGLTAFHFDGDSIKPISFSAAGSLPLYYFHPGNYFYFFYGDYLKNKDVEHIAARIKKFFSIKPNQAIYSDNITTGNSQFYMRIASNYLLAVLLTVWMIITVAMLKSRLEKPAVLQ